MHKMNLNIINNQPNHNWLDFFSRWFRQSQANDVGHDETHSQYFLQCAMKSSVANLDFLDPFWDFFLTV